MTDIDEIEKLHNEDVKTNSSYLFKVPVGKVLSRESALIAKVREIQGNRCDECGANLIGPCVRCGAPTCCPQCCRIDALLEKARELEKDKAGMWTDAREEGCYPRRNVRCIVATPEGVVQFQSWLIDCDDLESWWEEDGGNAAPLSAFPFWQPLPTLKQHGGEHE